MVLPNFAGLTLSDAPTTPIGGLALSRQVDTWLSTDVTAMREEVETVEAARSVLLALLATGEADAARLVIGALENCEDVAALCGTNRALAALCAAAGFWKVLCEVRGGLYLEENARAAVASGEAWRRDFARYPSEGGDWKVWYARVCREESLERREGRVLQAFLDDMLAESSALVAAAQAEDARTKEETLATMRRALVAQKKMQRAVAEAELRTALESVRALRAVRESVRSNPNTPGPVLAMVDRQVRQAEANALAVKRRVHS